MATIVLLLSLLAHSVDHDIHLSKSELNYDTKSSTLQMSICLFLDDTELALSNRGYSNSNLFSNKEVDNADKIISDYISDYLYFIVDGDTLQYSYIGREISDDLSAVWCYLESSPIESNANLKVSNKIFTEIYDDQKHVIVVTRDLKRVDHWILDEAPFTEEIRI